MTISKEEQPILKAVIKTTYAPVLGKAMVITFLTKLDNTRKERYSGKTNWSEILHTYSGEKMCRETILKLQFVKASLIKELLVQYDIYNDMDARDLYWDELSKYFDEYLQQITQIVYLKQFSKLAAIAKGDLAL